MRFDPVLRNALVVTSGVLVIAAIDIASNARPVSWSDGAFALAGAFPVMLLALLALVPAGRTV